MSPTHDKGAVLPDSGASAGVNNNQAYAIDMSTTELDRLVRLSELNDPHVRDAFSRLPHCAGAKIADVGCGALGALLALSELVGREGLVVGIDASRTSLQQARSILDQRWIGNVELICANIDELTPAIISPFGPFDAAFCRAFLVHQGDPAKTLSHIKSIVRPGGSIVLQEPLQADVPACDLEAAAINEAWAMAFDIVRRSGASPNVARQLSGLCEKAGLIVTSQRGFVSVTPAKAGTIVGERFYDLLLSMRAAAIRLGVASDTTINDLLARLRMVVTDRDLSLIGPIYLEAVATCP
jgi:2-polyprenyl-3-methyl-5-hydroxy-6-metoxy-1,4-benzoquinol methylase